MPKGKEKRFSACLCDKETDGKRKAAEKLVKHVLIAGIRPDVNCNEPKKTR